jgi:hypothetical protein
LLYNGLALEGLDDHDAQLVVAALCVDLGWGDPSAAVRRRPQVVLDHPGDVHDARGVAAAYEISARVLQL